jgi:L-methionine (R)-S-oxide reductase
MTAARSHLMTELENIVSHASDRLAALHLGAELLRRSQDYRWVGLYDVDGKTGVVTNVVWSGPGPPEHPTFAITKGLTGAAIAQKKTINVGEVAADERYLTTFRTTRSELIVPVFDQRRETVVGTIDIESEEPNAFAREVQILFEDCAGIMSCLWC